MESEITDEQIEELRRILIEQGKDENDPSFVSSEVMNRTYSI